METFREVAGSIWRPGCLGPRPRLLLTGMGSEHGWENANAGGGDGRPCGGCVLHRHAGGEGVTTVPWRTRTGHRKMEEMVEKGEVDGAVTMHFPFPHRCVHCGTGSNARPW